MTTYGSPVSRQAVLTPPHTYSPHMVTPAPFPLGHLCPAKPRWVNAAVLSRHVVAGVQVPEHRLRRKTRHFQRHDNCYGEGHGTLERDGKGRTAPGRPAGGDGADRGGMPPTGCRDCT